MIHHSSQNQTRKFGSWWLKILRPTAVYWFFSKILANERWQHKKFNSSHDRVSTFETMKVGRSRCTFVQKLFKVDTQLLKLYQVKVWKENFNYFKLRRDKRIWAKSLSLHRTKQLEIDGNLPTYYNFFTPHSNTDGFYWGK